MQFFVWALRTAILLQEEGQPRRSDQYQSMSCYPERSHKMHREFYGGYAQFTRSLRTKRRKPYVEVASVRLSVKFGVAALYKKLSKRYEFKERHLSENHTSVTETDEFTRVLSRVLDRFS